MLYLENQAPPSACHSVGIPAWSRSASCRWSAGFSCALLGYHPSHLAEERHRAACCPQLPAGGRGGTATTTSCRVEASWEQNTTKNCLGQQGECPPHVYLAGEVNRGRKQCTRGTETQYSILYKCWGATELQHGEILLAEAALTGEP